MRVKQPVAATIGAMIAKPCEVFNIGMIVSNNVFIADPSVIVLLP
jgi:hypothetical protein